jgi:hypothetical protein
MGLSRFQHIGVRWHSVFAVKFTGIRRLAGFLGVPFSAIKTAVFDYVFLFHPDLYGDIAVVEENMDFYYIPAKPEPFETEVTKILRRDPNNPLGELLQEFRDKRHSQFELEINALILFGMFPTYVWKYDVMRTVKKLREFITIPNHVMSKIRESSIGIQPPFQYPNRHVRNRTFERYKRLNQQQQQPPPPEPEVYIDVDDSPGSPRDIFLLDDSDEEVNDINTSDEEWLSGDRDILTL